MVQAGKVLFERGMDHTLVDEIRAAVETGPAGPGAAIVDPHVRRVGRVAWSCAISVLSADRSITPARLCGQNTAYQEVVDATPEIHYR